jgi:hypothetical protein
MDAKALRMYPRGILDPRSYEYRPIDRKTIEALIARVERLEALVQRQKAR